MALFPCNIGSSGGTSIDVGVITLSETDSITVDLGYQPTLLILFNYGTSNIFITTYNSDFSSTSAFGGTYTTNTAGSATIYNFPVAAGSEGQLLSVNSNGFTVSKRSRYIDRYTLTLRYMAFRQNPF